MGLDSPPRSEFIVAYRAMIPVEKLPWAKGVAGATSWLGPGRSIMCYLVSAGRQANLVAFVPTDRDIAESWSARAQVNALVAEFEGWDPTVLETIAAVEEMFRTGIYDREALPYWSDGRVTLLGDAAHAMVPHLGQGASQAIEDAFALAAILQNAQSDDVPGLLKRYEQLRLPRTSRVQSLAREAGRSRDAQAKRDEQMRSVLNDLDWLFTYDAEAAATDAAHVRR
jgi:salicylate hydroxylase